MPLTYSYSLTHLSQYVQGPGLLHLLFKVLENRGCKWNRKCFLNALSDLNPGNTMYFKCMQQDSDNAKEAFVRLKYFKQKNNQKTFLIFQSMIYGLFLY